VGVPERPVPDGPFPGRHFIAGEWIESGSGRSFDSRNPANRGDLVGQF
jgi:acyl-CoA reductase-like NAD-dependent aldehyde dehydrogenase